MSLELIKDKIIFDQKIGKEKTQILLEGDIIVPDIKPDVAFILKTDGKIHMDEYQMLNDKVSFDGDLVISVMYMAKNALKPVHSITTTMPIKDMLYLDNLKEDSYVMLQYELEHLEYKLINDRKISVKAVVTVSARATNKIQKDIVTDLKGDNNLQSIIKPVYISKALSNKDDRFVIKDQLTIPSQSPNIEEILKVTAKICDKDIRVSEEKVTAKGTIMVTTLYSGDAEASVVEMCEHEIPFNGVIDMKDAKEDMIGDCILKIDNEYVQIRPDDDGEDRVFDIELTILAEVKLLSQMEIGMVLDAYSVNKDVNLIKDVATFERLISTNKNQCNIKETIKLEAKCPNILSIQQVDGSPRIDEITITNDKVLIDGVIPTQILYLAESDEMPVYCYEGVIPFSHVVDAKGAKEGMEVSADYNVEHISYNLLSDSEVEVRYMIRFNVTVTEDIDAELVIDAEILDLDTSILDLIPSMIIYTVEEGDTLWKIAKCYHTVIDEIATLNDIEDVDKIYPGQKLLILKKIADD